MNPVERMWALVKKEHTLRMHRRDNDFQNEAEFRQFVQQVCDDVHIDPDAILRANHAYFAHYRALGAELSSSYSNE